MRASTNSCVLIACVIALVACDGDDPPRRQSLPKGAVTVSSKSARACDVVISTDADPVFSEAVRGAQLRRGAKVAISFIAREGTFGASPVELVPATPTSWSDLEIVSQVCYDALGKPIPNPGVQIVSGS